MVEVIDAGAESLVAVWDAHVAAELERKDVDAVLATMCADAVLLHVPVAAGARGTDELARFVAEVAVPSWPDDLTLTRRSRTVERARLVDEVLLRGTHDRPMPVWLPGIEPTGRRFELLRVTVVSFRDGLIESTSHYWDQASLLVQLGLLDTETTDGVPLPVLGVAQTRAATDPTYPLNELTERNRRAMR